MKKLFSIFTALVLSLGMLLPTFTVQAAYFPKKIEEYYYLKDSGDFGMWNRYWFPEKYTVLVDECTSSDKSVAVVEETEDYGGDVAMPYIDIKKPGTCKLKLVFRKSNGEKKICNVKFKAVKYKNPLAKFKIGKKDYTKKYNKTPLYGLKGKKNVSGKVYVKPAKGWKVKRIKASLVLHNGDGTQDYKTIKLKNKDKVELQYGSTLFIKLQNKKTKKTIEIEFEPGYRY